jgi:sulfur carrier protein
MQITVNGQARQVPAESSVSALLEQLELGSQHVAVEVNLQLVPRPQHAEHILQEGDQIEVVTLAGGG